MVGEEIAALILPGFWLEARSYGLTRHFQHTVGIAGLYPAGFGEGFFSPIAWQPFIPSLSKDWFSVTFSVPALQEPIADVRRAR
ncbi:hypothetical protein T8T21_09060 [Limimaricola variabilis]|uniref:hypothetical protein n=1 Tax=Limimaricola variabilis TaxID=1492771 RepID=UPI002AC9D9F7|nr:hypothetical protein [Limimaricola variabilis]WPY93276.1 hypothetical protein T8T21_09060 [Limimaricola variabilis]